MEKQRKEDKRNLQWSALLCKLKNHQTTKVRNAKCVKPFGARMLIDLIVRMVTDIP